MQDGRYLGLLAQIKAIELIVRGLFTKWALEADDPRASAFRIIEAVIGSMHAAGEGAGEGERQMLERIEEHLRAFGDCIDLRLTARERDG